MSNQPPSQASTNVPAQLNRENTNQDPATFYGSLFDQAGYPSETFCRMTDSLFFYVDYNCPQYRGTRVMEPEKMSWEFVALGYDAEGVSQFRKHDLFWTKTSVCDILIDCRLRVRLTQQWLQLNGSGAPVLDRRGYLHLRVFETLASPEEGHEDWNRYLDVFKLKDPKTGIPFPTPIPRSAFPAYPDYGRRSIYISWQTQAVAELKQEMTRANSSGSTPQPSRSTQQVESKESEIGQTVANAVVDVGGAVLTTFINGIFS